MSNRSPTPRQPQHGSWYCCRGWNWDCFCDVLSGRKRVIRKAASSSPQQECARAPRPCYQTLEHTKRISESGIHYAACLIERTVATSIVQHMGIHVTYQTTFKLSHALPAAQSRNRQNLGFWCTHAHISTRVMGRAAATFCGRHVMAESSIGTSLIWHAKF